MSTLALTPDRETGSAARLSGSDVAFSVDSDAGRFECRVTREVLLGFDLTASDTSDWVEIYLCHRERVDAVARMLIAHGLRGSHLTVCAHHFMD
jgi:hypothetical protein